MSRFRLLSHCALLLVLSLPLAAFKTGLRRHSGRMLSYVFQVHGGNRWGQFYLAGVVRLRLARGRCAVVAGEQDISMHGFYLGPHFFANGANRGLIQGGECRLNARGGVLRLDTGLPSVSIGPGEPPLGTETFTLRRRPDGTYLISELDPSAVGSGVLRRQSAIARQIPGSYLVRLSGESFAEATVQGYVLHPATQSVAVPAHAPVVWAGRLYLPASGKLATVPPESSQWQGQLGLSAPAIVAGHFGTLPGTLRAARPQPPAAEEVSGVAGPVDGFGRVVLDLNLEGGSHGPQQIALAGYEVNPRRLALVEVDPWLAVSGGEALRTERVASGARLVHSMPHPTAPSPHGAGADHGQPGRPILVGYWGDFSGPQSLPLHAVSRNFDYVDVIAEMPESADTATIPFSVNPRIESDADFRGDVHRLQRRGQKVLLTLGGGASFFQLNTAAEEERFVDSVSALVRRYGFDGVDVDFENDSVRLRPGDNDIFHPNSPDILHLISALHRLKRRFGARFLITLVPETQYVQGGLSAYGGLDGSYLPLILACRDILDFVDVQYYNSAPLTALDGRVYGQYTAGAEPGWSPDFQAAMTELLLHGFRVANGQEFPPLPARQVMFGMPAFGNNQVVQALRYLMSGRGFGGRYRLRSARAYPGLRGLMLWSINIDAHEGGKVSSAVGAYFRGAGE